MKVLVCGSRDWTDYGPIERELRKLPPGTIVVHGAARGADTIAGEIAKKLGFEVRAYPADWKAQPRAAGPIRNALMLKKEHPDADGVFIDQVLAFSKHFATTRGTTDMIEKALAKGIFVDSFSV